MVSGAGICVFTSWTTSTKQREQTRNGMSLNSQSPPLLAYFLQWGHKPYCKFPKWCNHVQMSETMGYILFKQPLGWVGSWTSIPNWWILTVNGFWKRKGQLSLGVSPLTDWLCSSRLGFYSTNWLIKLLHKIGNEDFQTLFWIHYFPDTKQDKDATRKKASTQQIH